MNLSKNVKKLRKKKGWSQAELAEILKCHTNHINRIETGKYIPSLEITTKIADVFEVSLDELVYNKSGVIEEVRLRDQSFNQKIKLLDGLGKEEKEVIGKVIDAMLTKKQMLDLLQTSQS